MLLSRTGQLGGVIGAGRAMLDLLFDPNVVNQVIRSGVQPVSTKGPWAAVPLQPPDSHRASITR